MFMSVSNIVSVVLTFLRKQQLQRQKMNEDIQLSNYTDELQLHLYQIQNM